MGLMSPETIIEQETDRVTYFGEPGDDEKFSHYAPKKELAAAIFDGVPCTALCGKKWVPTRDPEKFPVCPECKDIYESFPAVPPPT